MGSLDYNLPIVTEELIERVYRMYISTNTDEKSDGLLEKLSILFRPKAASKSTYVHGLEDTRDYIASNNSALGGLMSAPAKKFTEISDFTSVLEPAVLMYCVLIKTGEPIPVLEERTKQILIRRYTGDDKTYETDLKAAFNDLKRNNPFLFKFLKEQMDSKYKTGKISREILKAAAESLTLTYLALRVAGPNMDEFSVARVLKELEVNSQPLSL